MLQPKHTQEYILLKFVIKVNGLKKLYYSSITVILQYKILELCLESDIKQNFIKCYILSILKKIFYWN